MDDKTIPPSLDLLQEELYGVFEKKMDRHNSQLLEENQGEPTDAMPADNHSRAEHSTNPDSKLSKEWNIVMDSPEGEPSIVSEEETEEQSAVANDIQEMLVPQGELTNSGSENGLDLQTQRRLEQEQALRESSAEIIEPLKYLRKGAVAAVGGAMVGVGLIMIPLPTPFGAVVASSGMAVLGTEFEGAREMNEKIIGTTMFHLESAREHVIKSIESMHEEEEEEEVQEENLTPGPSNASEKEEGGDQRATPGTTESSTEQQQVAASSMQTKVLRPQTTKYFDHLKRHTKSYLTRNLIPLLKKTRPQDSQEEISESVSEPDAEATVQSELDNMSVADNSEQQIDDNTMEESEDPDKEAPLSTTVDNAKFDNAATVSPL